MFYRFSSILGRIEATTQLAAYKPQGVRPLAKYVASRPSESVQPQVTQAPDPVQSVPTRSASTGSAGAKRGLGLVPTSEGYRKFQDLQDHFMKDDGLMVWQKRGLRDMVPYYISIGLTVGGTLYALFCFYNMARPKKQ